MDYYSGTLSNGPEDVDVVCVAIKKVDEDQNHMGLFFTDEDGEVMLLHQPWHYRDLLTCFDPSYYWFDIALDPATKIHFATICALIASENPKGVPYGICFLGGNFSENGVYSPEEKYAGLTCATFVAQIFASQDLEIVDISLWEGVPPDEKWQTKILNNLEPYYTPEFLKYQMGRLVEGATRFRPEEVTAAAILKNPPHGPNDVADTAKQIVSII